MTTFILVRHAAHGLLGHRIVGRTPGVHLSEEGRAQAERLAETLAGAGIAAIHCSPLERACETAAPLARRLGLEPRVEAALNEIDYGAWSNRTVEELRREPLFDAYNRFRSGTRIPGGETALEALGRILAFAQGCHAERPGRTLALVSHGDMIRAFLAHCLGMHLDHLVRLQVDPASVSIVEWHDRGPQVRAVNRP